MKRPLWEASEEQKQQTNMAAFISIVNERHGLDLCGYDELWRWSVENIPDFWATVWDYTGIKASRPYVRVVDDLTKLPGARWFEGARLNFAENLLRFDDDHAAFVFRGEGGRRTQMSYAELRRTVARLAGSLREAGVVPGDRVVGYMPNVIETAVAMLAATSVGAVWSSCATDIGPAAALDRLGQVEPKVLFTADGYLYKGKRFDVVENAARLAAGIPSLEKVVVTPYSGGDSEISRIPRSVLWDDFLSKDEQALRFEQLPFSHPVYIMFSSGTTGRPKCLVQDCGVLVNQLKELLLHADLKRGDRHFYMTSCSWMMWNWLMASLGAGATIVLFEGCPTYPDLGEMWRIVQDEKVTLFGTSATYLGVLQKQGVRPGAEYDLSSLREILQTGSALSVEGFEYVYRDIKHDVHFNSISGGTDINGCFVAGDPTSPVYSGELQKRALGMKVEAYDDSGRPVLDQQGELVCEAPAPPMPIRFWDDPDGSRYRDAYFGYFENKSVWRHGDRIVIHSDTGGVTFYGRSDAVLKPSGVRIGTAEIYNTVQTIEGIADSLAIGQNLPDDQRVLLFVKMQPGVALDDDMKKKIKTALRENASPRHVPALILEAPDIPYTFSLKKVESAVTNIINGRPATNRGAIMNPESLDYYEKVAKELS